MWTALAALLLVTPGTMAATSPAKPAVTVSGADDVHPQQAALHGAVNPEGSDAEYYFQYGTTSYGTTSPVTDAGSGTASRPVSTFVRDLTPGTTYHFRLLAKNSQGITVSGDETFVTPYDACQAPPSSRIDLHRTHLTTQQLSVTGQAGERSCLHSSPADRRRNHVVRVLVAVYHRLSGGECEFLTRRGRLGQPTACGRPVELQAQGTSGWRLALQVRLPSQPSAYVIRSTAVDGFGRRQPPSRKSTDYVNVS